MGARKACRGAISALRLLPWAETPPSSSRWRLQALGGLWVSGGLLGLLAVLLRGSRNNAVPLTAIGAIAVLFGVLIIVRGCRFTAVTFVPQWAWHVLLVLGSATIGACVALAGGGSAPIAYGTLYVWIGIYSGAFFSPRATLSHVILAIVTFAGTLASLEQHIAADLLLVGGVTVTVAGLSSWMALQRGLASIDPVTGASNRRGLNRALEAALDQARSVSVPLALAVIDLDHFRRFNDHHGKVGGDRLLATAAARWVAQLPDHATLARIGGDEFAVVLPGCELLTASQLIDHFRGLLPDAQTCSAGVTLGLPSDTPSMILARADAALYEAKRAGRDCTSTMVDDSDVALELWMALNAGEFVLHYQPIQAMADGSLDGFEALIRWEHPIDGMRSPAEFLPAAERSGAIHAIGRWVLDEACRYIAGLHGQRGGGTPSIAVNISTRQLADDRLVSDVEYALRTSGLPPQALVLELTENALEGPTEAAAFTLWRLREMGVRLAIDDFGTGYSSLNRLRELPFDILKIDRSFVADIENDERRRALLAAIIGVADSLGLETVAEGIETDAQLKFLRENGCTHGQGYLLGRPAPTRHYSQDLDRQR